MGLTTSKLLKNEVQISCWELYIIVLYRPSLPSLFHMSFAAFWNRVYRVVPPYPQVICSKILKGCLKLQIVSTLMYTRLFPIRLAHCHMALDLHYIFKSERKRGRGNERERVSSHLLVHSLNVYDYWTEPGWSWDPGAQRTSLTWVDWTQLLEPSLFPPGIFISRKLESGGGAGCYWTQVLWYGSQAS